MGTAAAVSCALLLAGCGGGNDGADRPDTRHRPVSMAGKGAAQQPVPQGKGSKADDDFNGDGAPDLVLDDLVHSGHGDDAGIGVVYGSRSGLRPGARQLLSARANGARTKGELPAAFESEASCDLDKDGFTDLLVSTDPPYDGLGQPPVPLQIIFGSTQGLKGKAVKVKVPAQSRIGNDWSDQPVCGDFDGDGASDLVLHASGARLTFLRGPFKRTGAPRAAGKPLPRPATTSSPAGPRTSTATATTTSWSARQRTLPAPRRARSSWAARRARRDRGALPFRHGHRVRALRQGQGDRRGCRGPGGSRPALRRARHPALHA
ncbi:FG-GAP repeat domain-containing protein [Streptomyces rectiviolaceus]|uniref:FG-GAP repeat domain-containing protein n=1 Tax=Streptomyces rectiviolaceus TaxID=332591 RepID=UPI003629B5B0